LKTRIAGRRPDQPKLAAKDFQNASIITSLNAQKDKINELGSRHFAAETNQTLTHFHSVDHFGNSPDVSEKKRRGRKSKRTSKSVEEESLKELANIPLVLLVLGYKISYGIFLMQQLLIFLEDFLSVLGCL